MCQSSLFGTTGATETIEGNKTGIGMETSTQLRYIFVCAGSLHGSQFNRKMSSFPPSPSLPLPSPPLLSLPLPPSPPLSVGSPVDDFLTYFQKFGSKLCFFEDVRTFIPFLSEDEKKVLLERMSLVVNDLSIDYDCSEQDKKANVSYLCCLVYLLSLALFTCCLLHCLPVVSCIVYLLSLALFTCCLLHCLPVVSCTV